MGLRYSQTKREVKMTSMKGECMGRLMHYDEEVEDGLGEGDGVSSRWDSAAAGSNK